MGKLAVDGGKPVVRLEEIKQWPVIDERDKAAVMRVLESDYICGGDAPEATALEKEWREYVGRQFCLTTNSGTAALHMALAALGIGPGDEVLVPAYTFLASASCVLHANAIPVFVDIDRRTYTMEPSQIEAKISERTRAIIPVHLHGLSADMDEILKIARKHDLFVVEDACQAHGAEFKGKKVGTFGDLAAFSLNSSKNLCAGEGGLLVMDNHDYYMRASMLRMFGDEIDDETKLRVYNASILGYMYRNQELPAAFTRAQLQRLDEYNNARIKNCNYLTEHLSGIKGVHVPYIPDHYKHVYWMYIIEFYPEELGLSISPEEFRVGMEKALFAEGVQVGQWQTMPVPAQDLFQTKKGISSSGFPWNYTDRGRAIVYRGEDYPNSTDLCRRYTTVNGFQPPNGIDLMKKYVAAFEKVFANIDIVLKHKNDNLPSHFSGRLFRAK